MNSNMVKPEKFGHLHLVYHFTIPLSTGKIKIILFRTKEIKKTYEFEDKQTENKHVKEAKY